MIQRLISDKKKEEPDLKSQRSINQRIHSNIKNNIRTCTHFGDFNREHSFEADCKEKSKESGIIPRNKRSNGLENHFWSLLRAFRFDYWL